LAPDERLQILAAAIESSEPNRDPALQPDLTAGVHLRWSFAQPCGFPWFGYYLFRLDPDQVWRELPEFTYPLCLPLAAGATYPCFGAPTSEGDAESLARGRVRYGAADDALRNFHEIHAELRKLTVKPHVGGSMSETAERQQGGSVEMPAEHPLELLLLAALHPAVAQMLGLYFVDERADPAQRYRYLLLADHAGELAREAATKGFAASALDWAQANLLTTGNPPPANSLVDFALTDFVDFAPRPVQQPGNLKAYVLPSSPLGRTDQAPPAALTWELPGAPHEGEQSLPNPQRPVLFHVRRAHLGADVAPRPLPTVLEDWEVSTRNRPIVGLRRITPGVNDPRPSAQWPPFPPNAIDLPGSEGWYAFCVSGVDLFGRFSAPSAPAQWWQWEPPPNPLPWYYDASQGASMRHPSAVALLDKTPPPAPSLEASTLDRDDPTVVVDGLAMDFFAAHPGKVGLRLRWRWTAEQQRIAPDAAEFRLYWRAGTAQLGTAALHSLSAWQLRAAVIALDEVLTSVEVFNVTVLERSDRRLEGNDATQDTMDPTVVHLPTAAVDLRNVVPGVDSLRLDGVVHLIAGVDVSQLKVTLATPAGLAAPAAWSVGRRERQYDLAIVAPDSEPSQPFCPDRHTPVVSSLVALTAADNRTHSLDRWTGATATQAPLGRSGNESDVGTPALVVRVLREPAPDLEIASTPDTRFATPADYHGLSASTFRWKSQPGVKAHLLRALDEALFMADWSQRPRGAVDPDDPRLRAFGWPPAQRVVVAVALDAIDAIRRDPSIDEAARTARRDLAYRALGDDALRVLATLPGNEAAFIQLTLDPVDGADARGPDDPADYHPDATLRAFVDGTLPGRSRNRYLYRATFVDAALNRSRGASLPGGVVHLPRVDPPPTPLVTSVRTVAGGIHLAWQPMAEAAAYRVYRAERRTDAQTLRDMQRLAEVAAPLFLDNAVAAPRTYCYRLTAIVEEGGHLYESAPTSVLVARTFDPALLPEDLRGEPM
jgi:hypothetical protein